MTEEVARLQQEDFKLSNSLYDENMTLFRKKVNPPFPKTFNIIIDAVSSMPRDNLALPPVRGLKTLQYDNCHGSIDSFFRSKIRALGDRGNALNKKVTKVSTHQFVRSYRRSSRRISVHPPKWPILRRFATIHISYRHIKTPFSQQ